MKADTIPHVTTREGTAIGIVSGTVDGTRVVRDVVKAGVPRREHARRPAPFALLPGKYSDAVFGRAADGSAVSEVPITVIRSFLDIIN